MASGSTSSVRTSGLKSQEWMNVRIINGKRHTHEQGELLMKAILNFKETLSHLSQNLKMQN